jgi:mono/diheme cytochrome c family protein
MPRTLILALTLACFSSPVLAAKPHAAGASVAAGKQLALTVCSACHVVADKQEFEPLLIQKTPSFQNIADDPKTTAAGLRKFITATHWDEKTVPMTMPNQMLAGGQADEVVAYIMSLRKP